jgi:pilus assembly protein CpaE
MIIQLTTLVVDADPANREELSDFLVRLGVDVVGRLGGLDELPSALSGTRAQLLVANLDPDPLGGLQKLAPIMQQWPQLAVWTMSESTDPQLLMEAMHLGVREFIALPVQAHRLQRAIEKISHARRGSSKPAKLLVFVPTAGGCGSTTAASNVAVSLTQKGKTVLIDLDMAGGMIAEALDLRPRFSIADLCSGQIDATLIQNALTVHEPSGLMVLARPDMPEDARRIDAPVMGRLLGALAEMFEYIVVDSVLSVDGPYAVALKAADEVVLVVQLNVPSVRNASRFLQALRRMGVRVGGPGQPGTVRVVVNRMIKRGNEVSPEAAERALGLKLNWSIPNDFKSTMSAINYGEPVVLRSPRAEIATSLTGLAHLLNGRVGDLPAAPADAALASRPEQTRNPV